MNDEGYVYFLAERNRHNPKIKIGKTNNVSRRMEQIQPKLPTDSVLIHAIRTNDRHDLENYFHVMFSKKRLNGEWFELSSEDMLQISNTISAYYDDELKMGVWEIKRYCPNCKSYYVNYAFRDWHNAMKQYLCFKCEGWLE